MFGWNITKKHNQNSPTNQKRSIENSISHFSIQKSGYKVWFVLLLRMVLSAWRNPAPEVSRSPSCGKGWEGLWAAGKSAPDYLAGWQAVLSPSSRPPQNRLVLLARWTGVHETPRTGMWLRRGARTLCFLVGYTSRAKERERKSPTGKNRSRLSP